LFYILQEKKNFSRSQQEEYHNFSAKLASWDNMEEDKNAFSLVFNLLFIDLVTQLMKISGVYGRGRMFL